MTSTTAPPTSLAHSSTTTSSSIALHVTTTSSLLATDRQLARPTPAPTSTTDATSTTARPTGSESRTATTSAFTDQADQTGASGVYGADVHARKAPDATGDTATLMLSIVTLGIAGTITIGASWRRRRTDRQ